MGARIANSIHPAIVSSCTCPCRSALTCADECQAIEAESSCKGHSKCGHRRREHHSVTHKRSSSGPKLQQGFEQQFCGYEPCHCPKDCECHLRHATRLTHLTASAVRVTKELSSIPIQVDVLRLPSVCKARLQSGIYCLSSTSLLRARRLRSSLSLSGLITFRHESLLRCRALPGIGSRLSSIRTSHTCSKYCARKGYPCFEASCYCRLQRLCSLPESVAATPHLLPIKWLIELFIEATD